MKVVIVVKGHGSHSPRANPYAIRVQIRQGHQNGRVMSEVRSVVAYLEREVAGCSAAAGAVGHEVLGVYDAREVE